MAYRPETEAPLNALAEVLLRNQNSGFRCFIQEYNFDVKHHES